MREDIPQEWRYKRILEELYKIVPSRMNKSELLKQLGNEITEDILYTDVKYLSKIGYLITSFDSEKDFSTRIIKEGITALIRKNPEKKRSSHKNNGIISKLKKDWQGIVILSIGIIVTGYILWGVLIYGS